MTEPRRIPARARDGHAYPNVPTIPVRLTADTVAWHSNDDPANRRPLAAGTVLDLWGTDLGRCQQTGYACVVIDGDAWSVNGRLLVEAGP